MAKFFRKAWPHLLIAGLMVIFIIAAPRIYAHYFIKAGKPVEVLLPTETGQAKFNVEFLKPYDNKGIYKLEGWAFLTINPEIPAGAYEQQVVLISDTKRFAFSTESWSRPAVQQLFNYFGMDLTQSGFTALIAKDYLDEGIYSIGLIFRHNATYQAYYLSTGRCIRRTPNQLILEDPDSPVCSILPPPLIGAPIQQNISLPPEISSTYFWVDGSEPYNDQGVYSLWGWAFLTSDPAIPAGDYTRQIVLMTGVKNYAFSTITTDRPGVQDNFSNLGMDLTRSGFWLLINSNLIDSGSYTIGIILRHGNTAYLINTNRCLTRTSTGLVLEENGSNVCQPVAEATLEPNSSDLPNSKLPPQTLDAKFWVDGLEPHDDKGIYKLWGWAFLTSNPTIPAKDYTKQVVLMAGTENYDLFTISTERPGVQTTFSNLGMDLTWSGFWSLVDSNLLTPGPYSIGLIFTRGDTSLLINTNRCLTRTDTGLVLEENGSTKCYVP